METPRAMRRNLSSTIRTNMPQFRRCIPRSPRRITSPVVAEPLCSCMHRYSDADIRGGGVSFPASECHGTTASCGRIPIRSDVPVRDDTTQLKCLRARCPRKAFLYSKEVLHRPGSMIQSRLAIPLRGDARRMVDEPRSIFQVPHLEQ